MKISIMMKLRIITSVDGVEPLNNAAKITEKIIIYNIAMDAITTTYENTRNQIDERFSIL